MEVTRTNFRKVLPEIQDTINRCMFIAIDGEFTGLSSGLENKISAFDTPEEYYHKLKSGSLDFLFIQFGLAAFMYDEKEQKYTHREYNFYLFPKPVLRQAPDCRFMCQASSLDFLASHGFDFNKLFNEGIPYLNKDDELTMKTKLDEAKERRNSLGEQNNSYVQCPPVHADTVKNALNLIVDFLSTTHGLAELSLPPCNGFVRKLIYQEVWKRYTSDQLQIETNKNGVMVVKRPATLQEKELEKQKQLEDEKRQFEDAVGFSEVIRMISQSRKLLVGHNMLLDLCHILHRFCQPLPDSYQEFKELLHNVFPYILDTKFMCSRKPLVDNIPSSVLPHVMATVSKPPFHLLNIEPEGEYAYNTLEEKEHEAGFDAYVTGVIATSLSSYLAQHKPVELKGGEELLSAKSTHLQPFVNRLYLMKVMDTYVNLEQDDPKPNREAVFHVTFPEEWKTPDLLNMFSAYGSVQVSWIDNKTAYCSLNDKSQVVNVVRRLAPTPPAGVSVVTYYSFHNLTTLSPVKRRSGELPASQVKPNKRKLSQERRSLKRPSVDSIPEEPEQEVNEPEEEDQQRKRRKVANKSLQSMEKTTKPKLFDESEDW